jgi:hypothetical protein
MTHNMVSQQLWRCPEGLIEQALAQHPITDEVAVLNRHNGNFFYGQWTIKDEFKGTAWEQILNCIPHPIGEARIIKLTSGEAYPAHADIDNRWHLNLTGEKAFLIDLENTEMFECKHDNYWYYLNAGCIHSAVNYGPCDRLQLVVREPLRQFPTDTEYVNVSIGLSVLRESYRYKFDNRISPWLNRTNFNFGMRDFKWSAESVSFKLVKSLLPELEALITDEYSLSTY